MHGFSWGLPWFKQEGVMLKTNFPILQDFYQWKVVKVSDHMVNSNIKFGFPIRSTNKGTYIIEAGLPYRLKIWSMHWKKSAEIIQNIPSISLSLSKPIFSRPLQMNLSCIEQIPFNGFLLPVWLWICINNQSSCLTPF